MSKAQEAAQKAWEKFDTMMTGLSREEYIEACESMIETCEASIDGVKEDIRRLEEGRDL